MVKGLSKSIYLLFLFCKSTLQFKRMYIFCNSSIRQVLHTNVITVDTAVSQNISLSDYKKNTIHLLQTICYHALFGLNLAFCISMIFSIAMTFINNHQDICRIKINITNFFLYL